MNSPLRSAQNFLGVYSLVMGALALVALVLAALLYIFLPELERTAQILLGFAALFLVLFIIGAYSEVKAGVTSRQTRYGTNTGVMIAAFIGIAALLNVMAAQNRGRWDLTAGGQYTLARQTLTVLQNLEKPVKVVGFFTNDPQVQANRERAQNLLTEYRYQSDKISVEFVDPEEKPGIARQYEVRSNATLVFESEGRRRQITGIGEQDFTGAILNVTGTEQPTIYFVAGHGEHDVTSTDGNGYRFVYDGLIADNYEVLPLNLGALTKVPEDAALLVVAGPKRAFLEAETKVFNDYLDNGGKALVMINPTTPAEFGPMLARWGVVVKNGRVVDQAVFVQPDVTTPAVQGNQYIFSQITKGIAASFFPGAAGMDIAVPDDDKDHVFVSPLAITSFQSYLETNPDSVSFDEANDPLGPLPLVLIVEATKPIGQRPPRSSAQASATGSQEPAVKPTRMVVFADSDFATNEFFYSLGNSDLLLNSINWLTAQEELISIRPKPAEFRRLVIRQRDWNVILYSTVAFWPLVVLLGGVYAWWRRR